MHRGDRAEHLAEDVVDVDGVGGEAAAELAVEGAAPGAPRRSRRRRGTSGSRRWRPRRRRRNPWREGGASFWTPWPKRYWKIGADAPAGGGLGGGDGVELGEALAPPASRRRRGSRPPARRCACGLVQARGGADVDDVEVAREEVVERGDRGGDGELRRRPRRRGRRRCRRGPRPRTSRAAPCRPRCARRRCRSRRRRP